MCRLSEDLGKPLSQTPLICPNMSGCLGTAKAGLLDIQVSGHKKTLARMVATLVGVFCFGDKSCFRF